MKTETRNAGRAKGGRGPAGVAPVGLADVVLAGSCLSRKVMSCAKESDRARTAGSYVGARTGLEACSFRANSSALPVSHNSR